MDELIFSTDKLKDVLRFMIEDVFAIIDAFRIGINDIFDNTYAFNILKSFVKLLLRLIRGNTNNVFNNSTASIELLLSDVVI
jgi:hypothetical protein